MDERNMHALYLVCKSEQSYIDALKIIVAELSREIEDLKRCIKHGY